MTKRDRGRLRKSIEREAANAIYNMALDAGDPILEEDVWITEGGSAYRGQAVTDECRAVYERVCKALGVKARKG